MQLVKLHSVIVGDNRQRRKFDKDALKRLADSIKRNGLLHPICVESLDNPRLRSGQRRLIAITQYVDGLYSHNNSQIEPGFIPVIVSGELSDLQAHEIELEENIIREDLTWQERTDAISKLHHLRSNQARETEGQPPQTYTATAREIKGAEVTAQDILEVREATMLQPFLEDPDVKKASSKREALSIVRKKLVQGFNAELAKRFDTSKGVKGHTPLHGSCLDVLPGIEPNQFDVIIVDPPYGIDAHKMTAMSGSQSGVVHEYEDSVENAEKIWTAIFKEGTRVCKSQAHLYMFCDFRHFQRLHSLATHFSWDVWPTPIIWHKPSGGMLGDSSRGPRKSYETILFARRGDKRVTGVFLDVIIEQAADASIHAASKPTAVYTNLLRRSCVPGDSVLDACSGSGTIFPAANRLRLVATGIEVSEVHYAAGLQRLGEP